MWLDAMVGGKGRRLTGLHSLLCRVESSQPLCYVRLSNKNLFFELISVCVFCCVVVGMNVCNVSEVFFWVTCSVTNARPDTGPWFCLCTVRSFILRLCTY